MSCAFRHHALRISLLLSLAAGVAFGLRALLLIVDHAHLRVLATTAASTLLVAGSIGALRGRTWGILLNATTATTFLGVALYGIAPAWFAAAAAVAAMPLVLTARPMWRFDAVACALAIGLAGGTGAAATLLVGPGYDAIERAMPKVDPQKKRPRQCRHAHMRD